MGGCSDPVYCTRREQSRIQGGLWGAVETLSTAHGGSRGGSRGAMGGCTDPVYCTRREQRRIQGGYGGL